jgi:5-methylcytosine-specific restriction endonuclease McrA
MIAEVIERNLPCHLCKKPFMSRADITADHLIPGNPNSALAPAHKSCNSSRGNKPL